MSEPNEVKNKRICITGGKGDNYEIYGNLIAFCKSNLEYWEDDNTSDDAWENHKIFNNTFVEGYCNGIELDNVDCFSNCAIKNNIVWQTEGDFIIDIPNSGFTFDYNLWWDTTEIDLDDDAKGNNDVYADPLLKDSIIWRNLSSGDLDGDEFELRNNSPAINQGDSLGGFEMMLEEGSVFPNDVSLENQNNWYDWEIGAFVYNHHPNKSSVVDNNLPISITKIQSSSPNPFHQKLHIRLFLCGPFSDNVKLSIHDAVGETIRTFDGLTEHIIWDGKDNSQRDAPSGVYFIRLDTPIYAETWKVIKLR